MPTISRREALLGIAGAAAGMGLAACGPASNASEEAGRGMVVDKDASGEAQVTTSESADLPFSLDGVPWAGRLIQADAGADAATLEGEWTFGGDYARIGSFPIDVRTVFGSATQDPSDVTGYVAALIGPEEIDELEEPTREEPFFEPQDGSGTADLLVWRCSELSNLPVNGADNWQIRAWDSASGVVRVVASAEALNGTRQTPMLDAEVVPTANSDATFFSTNAKDGDAWVPTVISCDLAEDAEPSAIGHGIYVAATEGGALWAQLEDDSGSSTLCTSLMRWDGSSSERVFSLTSDAPWGISGVWCHGDVVAVGFTASDASRGSYIGVWRDNLRELVCWVQTDSPRVIATVNGSWLVWGAGSEADNTGMFALNLGSGGVTYLGDAPGYSRPTIAQEDDVVMVPVTHGNDAVTFRVGRLVG